VKTGWVTRPAPLVAGLDGDPGCAAPHRHPVWHRAAAHRAELLFVALADRAQTRPNETFWVRAVRPAASWARSPLNPRLHPAALTLLWKVVVVRQRRAVQRISILGARRQVVRG
jgi:hypothetical protein